MALKVEGVANGGMHAEKALGGASRLEALHFALSSSNYLMRIFPLIGRSQPLLMRAGQSQTPECGGVEAQLVAGAAVARSIAGPNFNTQRRTVS